MVRVLVPALGACTLALGALPGVADGSGGMTTRVSVSSTGVEGTGTSSSPPQAFSADGRLVAFDSQASNLVEGDDNASTDAFLHDLNSDETKIIGLSSMGEQGIYGSGGSAIAANGKVVAFASVSPNLVPGDTNNKTDVFIRDLKSGITTRVSVGEGGVEGNGHTAGFWISADGNVIAFGSDASNMVPGDTNGWTDVFVRDVKAATTTRVSIGTAGEEGNSASHTPTISADGRYVAFESTATNFVGTFTILWPRIFLHDVVTGITTAPVLDMNGSIEMASAENPVLSADGRYLAYDSAAAILAPGNTNSYVDTFVLDLATGQTTRVSVTPGGSEGNNHSTDPSISADGRYVAFRSSASDLVPGGTNGLQHIYVRDLVLDQTTLESVSTAGELADSSCRNPCISADGRLVSFDSAATNLVPHTTNWPWKDVFVRTRPLQGPEPYCVAQKNSLGCTPAIASTGLPSATAGTGFHVTASQIVNAKPGMLIYSLHGPTLQPFAGGLLCLKAPVRRTPLANSGGSPPPAADCTGSFGFDFNAFIAASANPALVAGQGVWCQYWSRDPGAPSSTNLTDALAFVIGS